MVDLERHHPVAVLEGRTAEPLVTWWQRHPSVMILVRDRAGASALAGRQGAPDALQGADRFHFVQNVRDALNTRLHSRRWRQPATAAPPDVWLASTAPPTLFATPQHVPQPTPRKRAVWEAVPQRRGLGPSLRQVAQALGRDRRTVRRDLTREQPPVSPVRRPRATPLTPSMAYRGERWAQGCHQARRLSQELVQRGYQGSASLVRKVLQPWRARPEVSPPTLTPAPRTWLLLQPAARVSDADREPLERFLRANPWLAHGDALKNRVHTLLDQQDRAAFDEGRQEAETSDLPSFHTVARSFRQDDAAMIAALTTPWSTGPCEGQICRVKLLKRLGYGRAKLDLLRQRILHRTVAPIPLAGGERQVQQQGAA